jgi:hypothetical protein
VEMLELPLNMLGDLDVQRGVFVRDKCVIEIYHEALLPYLFLQVIVSQKAFTCLYAIKTVFGGRMLQWGRCSGRAVAIQ